jgi:hypothetical protein
MLRHARRILGAERPHPRANLQREHFGRGELQQGGEFQRDHVSVCVFSSVASHIVRSAGIKT